MYAFKYMAVSLRERKINVSRMNGRILFDKMVEWTADVDSIRWGEQHLFMP